jgi:hypothetical protein
MLMMNCAGGYQQSLIRALGTLGTLDALGAP